MTPADEPLTAHNSANSVDHLSTGVLGTADIIFMVIAAAAPMAVVVALMPIAFGFGNGGGAPGAWLGAVIAMLLFAIGYVQIIPFVRNAGAFYAYISASIGRVAGLGAAYVAAFSYFALSCSTLTALAFFAEKFFESATGHAAHWGIWAFAAALTVTWLSYRQITLAASVLGVALVAETAILLILDVKIFYDVGWSGFDIADFSVNRVFVPGLGITGIYAFNSMIGIEGTAIYQEEAKNRAVTIPRATYLAIGMIGLFYVLTAWCLTSSAGASLIGSIARADPGSFVANRSLVHLGKAGKAAVDILVLTSAFAAVLGLFNNSARYLYALARDGVLPRALAHTHPIHHSPHVAAFTLSAAMGLVIVVALLLGLDPLVNVTTALTGLGSVGLMALLSVTSLAIPVFFIRAKRIGVANCLSPAVGGIVITSATVLAFLNYPALTGVDSPIINHLPYALIVLFVGGAVQALWFRARRPAVYRLIGSNRVDG